MNSRSLAALLVVLFGVSATGSAQQLRYMDSSGNIHFVDNVYQIPPRYRQQVETPTPVPVLDSKGLAQKRRQEEQTRRQKIEDERKKRAEERQRKREENERKKEEAKRNRMKRKASGFGRLP